jgi:hypothetical protein
MTYKGMIYKGMITIETVKQFCDSLRSGYVENIEQDDNEIRISIRDGVDDEPSQNAIIAARGVIGEIRTKFGDAVKVGSEVIDEWVDVVVNLK